MIFSTVRQVENVEKHFFTAYKCMCLKNTEYFAEKFMKSFILFSLHFDSVFVFYFYSDLCLSKKKGRTLHHHRFISLFPQPYHRVLCEKHIHFVFGIRFRYSNKSMKWCSERVVCWYFSKIVFKTLVWMTYLKNTYLKDFRMLQFFFTSFFYIHNFYWNILQICF